MITVILGGSHMARVGLKALESALWDRELETLVLQVRRLLGEAVTAQTIERAFLRHRLSNTEVAPIERFQAALKAELRAAIRLH